MKVLTDASSLVMSFEMLNSIQKPSVLGLFELARFVEAIILHEKVIVLDTSSAGSAEEEQLQIARASIPGDFIAIEKMSAYDVITQYVDRSCSGFSRDLERDSSFMNRSDNDRKYDPVVARIKSLVLNADSDKQAKYAELLTKLWQDTIPAPTADQSKSKSWLDFFLSPSTKVPRGEPENPWAALTEKRLARNDWWWGNCGPSRGSLLDVYEDPGAVFDAYCRIYELCDPSGGSGFSQWRNSNRGSYKQFAQSMFSRANLYILAGELLDAPYRPGALRWPICWHHFTQRQVEDTSVSEAFVRLAERLQKKQQDQLKAYLGNGTVSVAIPQFLLVVMRDSKRPEDIFKKAVSLRWSSEAAAFRKHSQTLTAKLEGGRFDVMLRDFSDCSRQLSDTFGLTEEATKWTLLSAPSISMKPYGSWDTAGSIRATGLNLAELGATIWKWWVRRRYALVVRAAREAATVKSLASEVQRLFKVTMDESHFQLLSELESFGQTSEDVKKGG